VKPVSYSQNDEEKHILSEFGAEGTLLDIGAFDGKIFSNSLALIERGWSGVLVEPSPLPFDKLLTLHGFNIRLNLVHTLIGLERGIVPMWTTEDAVSTTERSNYDTWKESAIFKPKSFLSQITLWDLMKRFPGLERVDFVSIDTEGTSAALFLAFPFFLCRPKVFCVEHDNEKEKITNLAYKHGYEVKYESNENLVLVRK
jgi:FkbM family methyltransferase